MKRIITPDAALPLTISTEQVCFIILKGREFGVKDVETEPDPASNTTDDDALEILEGHSGDLIQQELSSFIESLGLDEQVDLVALTWLGRGEGDAGDWLGLRNRAADAHSDFTADYLLGDPLFPDYLEEGLEIAGRSCNDTEPERL
ncbi:DUF3775 domain-containing protein [Tepidicaulis sp. LMO-SS28]|uniref:DUF3775 domain-containing protein n=1 Tax=Tepidicaulis sp. LMO-SS28 TaxID=3447455 RepID=UPI003EE11E1B